MAIVKIPQPFQNFDCPIRWMLDIIRKRPAEQLTELVKVVKTGKLGNNWDNQGLRDNVQHPTFSYHSPELYTFIFEKLFLATAAILVLEDGVRALAYLDSVKHTSKKLTGDHHHVRMVTIVFVEILQQSASLQNSLPTEPDKTRMKTIKKKLQKLKRHTECQAVIEFMKLSLNVSLGVFNKNILIDLEKITDLAPSYFLWYYYQFRYLRNERIKAEKENKKEPAKFPEENAIQKAYKLRPSCLLTIYWMATMKLEKLHFAHPVTTQPGGTNRRRITWTAEDNALYSQCRELLINALLLCQTENRDDWANIILKQLQCLPNFEAQKLDALNAPFELAMKTCGQTYSESANVSENIAKFHDREARAQFRVLNESIIAASESYKASLKLNPENIELYWDYLNFLGFHPLAGLLEYNELGQILKTNINKIQNKQHIPALMTLYGVLVWVFYPNNARGRQGKQLACKYWIEALCKFPAAKNEIMNILEDPPVFLMHLGIKKKAVINHMLLIIHLNSIREELEDDDNERDEEKLLALFTLWTLGKSNFPLPVPPPYAIERDNYEDWLEKEKLADSLGGPKPNSNFTTNSIKIKTRNFSISDADDNWRRK